MKLSGAMETRKRGPASELIVSYLARHFGILRPDPAAVRLHPDLVQWLIAQRKDLADVVSRSTGLNLGTRLLTDVAIWPVGRALPEAMITAAARSLPLTRLSKTTTAAVITRTSSRAAMSSSSLITRRRSRSSI